MSDLISRKFPTYWKFPTYYIGKIVLQVGPKNTHKISRKFPIYISEISDLICRTNCPPNRTKKHSEIKSKISNIYRKFLFYYIGKIVLQVGQKHTCKISRKFPIYIGNFRLIMSD